MKRREREKREKRDLDNLLGDLGSHILQGDVFTVLNAHYHSMDPHWDTRSFLETILNCHLPGEREVRDGPECSDIPPSLAGEGKEGPQHKQTTAQNDLLPHSFKQ